MIPYTVRAATTALSTANDLLTTTGGATRSICIPEIDIEGAGTTSAYSEMAWQRVTTAGATPVAFTPVPVNQASPASSFTCATGWTTQPVVTAATNVHFVGINHNGQRYFWRAQNLYDCIPQQGGANAAAQLSGGRAIVANGSVSMRMRVVEL